MYLPYPIYPNEANIAKIDTLFLIKTAKKSHPFGPHILMEVSFLEISVHMALLGGYRYRLLYYSGLLSDLN